MMPTTPYLPHPEQLTLERSTPGGAYFVAWNADGTRYRLFALPLGGFPDGAARGSRWRACTSRRKRATFTCAAGHQHGSKVNADLCEAAMDARAEAEAAERDEVGP